MPRLRWHTRERAQILPFFAIALIPLLALLGLVVDGGQLYVQRRTAQNAADAGALAGARALRFATAGLDTTIGSAICTYVVANTFGTTPVPTANFVDGTGADVGTIRLAPNCSGSPAPTWIPTTAAGVRVRTNIGPLRTFLIGIVGISQLNTAATAAAGVGIPLVNAANAPVAGCGPSMTENDPRLQSLNITDATGAILTTSPPMGYSFTLQGSQLDVYSPTPDSNPPGPCPVYTGNSFKGNIDPTAPITLPSNVPLAHGNYVADMDSACAATGQPQSTSSPVTSQCHLFIPITDGNNPADNAHIVDFACMRVFSGNGLAQWSGVLEPTTTCAPFYTYTNSWTWGTSNSSAARVMLFQ